ncbi:MAG: LytTR family DNA-binding domain-containing protein [Erythrobacter sp.]
MGATLRRMNSSITGARKSLARKILIDLAIMTIIGTGLALIGPFGSFNDPLSTRLMVWLGFSYAGYAIYSPMGWVVERLHQSLDLPRAGLWLAAAIISSVPMTLLVGMVGPLPNAVALPSATKFFMQYPYVFVIGGGITLLFNQIQGAPEKASTSAPIAPAGPVSPAEPTALDASNAPRLLERLPPALGTTILALENEDHYVRVHTALGSDLILMRMRDAMAELEPLEGMQVHRSWWVARDAVEDVKRDGRNLRLVLAGGLEAPVSRANVTVLRDSGWI